MKKMIVLYTSLFLLIATSLGQAASGPKWWENGIIYQIYPRSFKDNNNDGIGDLQGIISKLDYLSDLGVSGVWLSPIYPSPMVDFGYDISNFTDVHPDFGTLNDFDTLVQEAHSRGLRIIMDFVPNHSSDEHPWFLKSLAKESGFEDYYVWRDPAGMDSDGKPIPPNNWLSLFYGPAWTYREERKQFYLHQFASAQPDLNYTNPQVVEEMQKVIIFWMNRGVDGFRIDAIPFLFESEGQEDEPVNLQGPADPMDYDHLNHIYTRDYPGTYEVVRDWRKIIDEQSNIDGIDRCIMVEAYASIPYTMDYFGTAENPIAHFPFNFQFIPLTNATTARDLRRLINEWVDNVPVHGHHNWLVGNHDNHRIGSRVGEDLIDAMNILVLTLPGTAVTYYGEEIGMLDNKAITYEQGQDPEGCNNPPEFFPEKTRDFERTPFQWDSSTNAGFNTGHETWLPVHENYKSVNVQAEKEDPRSHFNIYKKLVSLRTAPALQQGALTATVQGNTLAILRSLGSSEYAVVLINPSDVDDMINLDVAFVLGRNTKLSVYTASQHTDVEDGTILEAGLVPVPARSALVLLPAKEL